MTHSALLLLLDALAVFRLTRLIGEDEITARIRELAVGRTHGHSRDFSGARIAIVRRQWLAQLLACPWCLSVWVAVPVVAAQALIPRAWLYAAAALAFSAVTGLLARLS